MTDVGSLYSVHAIFYVKYCARFKLDKFISKQWGCGQYNIILVCGCVVQHRCSLGLLGPISDLLDYYCNFCATFLYLRIGLRSQQNLFNPQISTWCKLLLASRLKEITEIRNITKSVRHTTCNYSLWWHCVDCRQLAANKIPAFMNIPAVIRVKHGITVFSCFTTLFSSTFDT